MNDWAEFRHFKYLLAIAEHKGFRAAAEYFGESTTTSDTYTVGTLVVDLFDAKTKNLVWRGVSSGMLSDKSDKNIKSLNRGVQKLFQHFPPDALKNS